jgi:hypothetical protein
MPRHVGVLAFLLGAAVALGGCGRSPPEAAPQPAASTVVAGAAPAGGEDGPACASQPPQPVPLPGQPPPQLPPLTITLGQPGEPAPVGEVPFNHKAHAGDCKMPCLSCHVYADKSPVAGLPSGRKCMGCHKFVAKEKPAVRTLAARFKAGQPLRWERIFAVPDFVYFSHRVHLHAKEKMECKDCHGDIAAMKVVRQEQPFTMGRCLECHERKKASRDCLACHK